jgi:hypothetical protein
VECVCRCSLSGAAGQAPPPVSLPVGFTTFPGEIFAAPRSWVEKAYSNLVYFNEVDRGGHFAAWEEPDLFATELRAALSALRLRDLSQKPPRIRRQEWRSLLLDPLRTRMPYEEDGRVELRIRSRGPSGSRDSTGPSSERAPYSSSGARSGGRSRKRPPGSRSQTLETGLSFFGLGVKAPTASWGNLLSTAPDYYLTQPWLMLWPGAAVLLATLAFNLLGDGLRGALDPRSSS